LRGGGIGQERGKERGKERGRERRKERVSDGGRTEGGKGEGEEDDYYCAVL
jgi:hypothetical protein